MLKKISCRGALGFPLGISIGFLISIVTSLAWGRGDYYPCTPVLLQHFDSEIGAVLFQTVLSGILGAVFAGGSVIWEIERWSIMKQTGIYFLIAALSMLPIAYFAYWMPHSLLGFLIYFAIFLVIFISIWLIQYALWQRKIAQFKDKVRERG